ncbi:feMo cofactor biosynthesis protein NifB [bacterium BMS3Abin10]|nr:feMo cofactor biosynthesis protein NifB [bacterium BMS3Abin10]
MSIDISNHPCFNDKIRHTYGRVHLPVASRCNVQCNFCNRKYDCVNESRPGVTSAVLSPYQALHYLEHVMEKKSNISVVGIAGPGDPFANAEETMQTLRLVREKYPDMILCVATNGLDIEPYIDEIAALDVSHVTITINAVEPETGARIYSWVRHKKKVYNPEQGAKILLENQLNAVKALKEKGVTIKINSIIIPGINDDHIPAVAGKVSELGVDILNCVPYYRNKGAAFEDIEEPSPQVIQRVRKEAGKYVLQMHHCTRCRADAVGLLGEETDKELMGKLMECGDMPLRPADDRPYIAVASREGVLVNQHLGEAEQLLIFGKKDNGIKLIEARKTPDRGSGTERWEKLSESLKDCCTLLVSGIGENPRQVLGKRGINVLVLEGLIEEAVTAVFTGKNISHLMKRERTVCGDDCSGTGGGCS